MTRSRSRELATGLVLLAGLAACADSPAAPEPPQPAYTSHPFTLLVWPAVADLIAGATQVFEAYASPQDPDTPPDLGPDGEPGTDDDEFRPVTVFWSVVGNIGAIDPMSGAFTTLSADLPDGSTLETGKVIGESTGGIGEADVTVVEDSEPIADNTLVVEYKDGSKNVEKPLHAFAAYITFDAGKQFGVVLKTAGDDKLEASAPEETTAVFVRFNPQGKVTRVQWIGGAGVALGENTFTKVELLAEDKGGRIRKIQRLSSGGDAIDLPTNGIAKVDMSVK